jgi:uncharacterized SAM-binding protein YcdF (DUF218 family)
VKDVNRVLKKYWIPFLLGVVLILFSTIPLRLAIAYHSYPQPQAIFTLGGGDSREVFTAEFAKAHPTLKIWVSSGSPRTLAQSIFRGTGVSLSRVHLDYRAVDTVTNFTSMVNIFEQKKVFHLYLLTSSFHMARAKTIAFFVLGSRGIAFTPIEIPSRQKPELGYEVFRDGARSLFWLLTGRTGASLKSQL